ncbi:hypothetical protein [Gloeothece verrucosa]|uniref:Uncharacterized protein n=1 Tax=Gloeothece verrucosa (strain PCC 7822) TaxID=497965 RepID=E0UHV1_GLOV7|nr:hypothetical protein [Gloeothece verrucosa]ADN14481.1 conserved hypothetical protein [Gloeothece verrucosa PCC 7822]
MQRQTMNLGNWINNSLIFLLIIYMIKTALGIDLVKQCHAEEVLVGICSPSQAQNNWINWTGERIPY